MCYQKEPIICWTDFSLYFKLTTTNESFVAMGSSHSNVPTGILSQIAI